MQTNKKIIIYFFSITALFIVVIFVLYFIQNKKIQDKIQQETVLYFDEEGIPASDTVLYEWGGWQNIPSLDSLISLVSRQNGGFINKVVMYKDTKTKKYFSKIEIIGDYDKLSLFFSFTEAKGWFIEQEKAVPKKIRIALDEKLQTPPAEPAEPIINE